VGKAVASNRGAIYRLRKLIICVITRSSFYLGQIHEYWWSEDSVGREKATIYELFDRRP